MAEAAKVHNVSYALVSKKSDNYVLTVTDGRQCTLQRDVDFGRPTPKIKKPILYKAGAEKVLWEYGVIDRYELMHSIEDYENGFFMYRFKCSLIAVNNQTGEEVVIKEGYGSANTREASTGGQSGFDGANSRLKMAEKRAMVDAVIKLARLSALFTQDIENEDFMEAGTAMINAKETDFITAKQRQRLFAIGANAGLSTEQVKNVIKAQGFGSTKEIKQSEYDALCTAIQDYTPPQKGE